MTDDSRTRILTRIAAALGRDSSAASRTAAASYAQIPRDYRMTNVKKDRSVQDLFVQRLHEYDAACSRVATLVDLPAAIAAAIAARRLATLAVVSGVPAEWLPKGWDFPVAESLSALDLDRVPCILTGCTVAIAETGSIVLQSCLGQGLRRHTLIPDVHLCVVLESQLVASVPQAFPRLVPDLPTTFISGPSATADIEMTRIRGVHGPRTLHVLLVAD